MRPAYTARRPRQGFTLVEMLTVIVIIGILAALTLTAVQSARSSARNAVIKTDITQLAMALEAYKTKHGEYPPDFCGVTSSDDVIRNAAQDAVIRHFMKVYPRTGLRPDPAVDDTAWTTFQTAISSQYKVTMDVGGTPTQVPVDVNTFDGAVALLFWLGGLPDAEGKLLGFHTNPTNPFQGGSPRSQPFFEFKEERVRYTVSGPSGSEVVTMRFYSSDDFTSSAPYVYFRPNRVQIAAGDYRNEYGLASGTTFVPSKYIHDVGNEAVAYLEGDAGADPSVLANDRTWRDDRFQIVSAGIDGQFSDGENGTPSDYRYTRTGVNYTAADRDNVTNFIDVATLGDEL
jgi:prepilin-type N-terminal cleavage/methylation domain-containing protein